MVAQGHIQQSQKEKENWLKSDFCGGCALKLNYYNLNLSDEGFWMSDSNQCWVLLYGI